MSLGWPDKSFFFICVGRRCHVSGRRHRVPWGEWPPKRFPLWCCKWGYCPAIVLHTVHVVLLNPGNNSVELGVTGWVPKTAGYEIKFGK